MIVETHMKMGFRRQMALRPIVSSKEVVDATLLSVGAGVTSATSICTVVNDYVGTVGSVPVGAKVGSLFLFVQIIPTATTENVDWFISKFPAGVTMPIPGVVGGTTARKYILHEEKGIPGNASDGAYPATFKGVIKIPRGRQRMAEGDLIQVRTRGVGVHNVCIKAIYKGLR